MRSTSKSETVVSSVLANVMIVFLYFSVSSKQFINMKGFLFFLSKEFIEGEETLEETIKLSAGCE